MSRKQMTFQRVQQTECRNVKQQANQLLKYFKTWTY